MTRLRLAFVTRRFWPLVGENEMLVASLAAELRRRGHLPTVITPKYDKHWPANVCVREVPVVRLPHPAPRTWGNVRYSFALSRWLQQRQNQLDAVVVSSSPEDSLTVLGAVRASRVAVVAQQELGAELEAVPRRFGDQLLRRLRACDAFVTFGDAPSDKPPAAWMSLEQQRQIELGVPLPPTRTPAAKAAARQALAEVNHDLATAPDAAVALCLPPLLSDADLEPLARAWRIVQSRWPEARLWIVGDGPKRSSLFTLLSDLNLKYRIVLPGTFDDWDVLLQAADLFVQLGPDSPPSWAGRQARGAALPVVIFPSKEPTTPLPGDGWPPGEVAVPPALHVSCSDSGQLAERLAFLLEQPAAAVRIGQQARRLVEAQSSFSAMVDAYEEVLRSLVARRRQAPGPA